MTQTNNVHCFDKAITFTDIHFGLKNNSTVHNEDCISFIKEMINVAKELGIKKCIFMGDYFHNRNTINIHTLNYGLEGLKLLNDNFETSWFLVGNHDMYHRHNRDITSINMANSFDNIKFINEIYTEGDCTFLPFLINDEHHTLRSIKSKYVFGHLELPGYLLNKMVVMPEHNGETQEDFEQCEWVFSGHFHKRQIKKLSNGKTNICYTGNCFPHDFSDAWDDERGMMVIEHGKEPVFIKYTKAPMYRTFKLSELLSNPEYYIGSNTHASVDIDIPLKIDELNYIRETFNEVFKMREFKYIHNNALSQITVQSSMSNTTNKSIDEIVIEQINQLESSVLDKSLMIDIYKSLTTKKD